MTEPKERFQTLKAWAHWAKANPVDDDQALMAKDVSNLFALLGNLEYRLGEKDAQIVRLQSTFETLKEKIKEGSLDKEYKYET